MRHYLQYTPLIFFTLSLTASAQNVDPYEFSGPGCATHGAWTQTALTETRSIANVLSSLLSDPNCKGLAGAVEGLTIASQNMAITAAEAPRGENQKNEQNIDNLRSLSQVIIGPNGQPNASIANTFFTNLINTAKNSSYLPSVVTNRLSNPANVINSFASLYQTSAHTSEQGMNALSSIMKVLPQYDQCLIGHPNEGLLVLSGLVKMTSALSSSGSGSKNAIGTALAGLATMMRDRKFTVALRQTRRTTFNDSVSCLIETVSQHWCEINNAQEIMDYFQKQRDLNVQQNVERSATLRMNQKQRSSMGRAGNELPLIRSNPLNGFYLLTRELPIISDWLQRVQIGAKPGLHTDAQFQNEVLDKVTAFQKLAKTAQGQYNEDIKVLNTLTDVNVKRNHIFTTLVKLIGNLSASEMGDAGFISNTVNNAKLPFYLIGLKDIPPACTSAAGNQKVDWSEWMQKNIAYGNGYVPQFNDPDALAREIQTQMDTLLEGARGNASVYYRNFLIADRVNLVNETSTGPVLTVKGAFQNIYLYLSSLEKDLRDADTSPITLASILEFKQGIRRFNEAFKAYEQLAIQLDSQVIQIVKNPDMKNRSSAYSDLNIARKVQDAADQVISSAFDEFNIIQSRDGYVTNKMRTFIQMDLKNRLEASRNAEKMSSSTQAILTDTQKELLNYTLKVVTDDPTLAQLDLAQAKAIETSNLYTLSRVFKDTLYYMILEKKSYVERWNGEEFGQRIKRKLAENSSSIQGTIMPWMAWTAGEAKHPDLYSELNYLYHGTHLDDQFHSYQRTMALYCSLSLSFYNRSYFMDICRGSVLPSYFHENRKSLDFRYDSFLPNPAAAEKVAHDPLLNANAVCALNRHLIYNKIAYIRDQERTWTDTPTSDRADKTEDLFNEADEQAIGNH